MKKLLFIFGTIIATNVFAATQVTVVPVSRAHQLIVGQHTDTTVTNISKAVDGNVPYGYLMSTNTADVYVNWQVPVFQIYGTNCQYTLYSIHTNADVGSGWSYQINLYNATRGLIYSYSNTVLHTNVPIDSYTNYMVMHATNTFPPYIMSTNIAYADTIVRRVRDNSAQRVWLIGGKILFY